MGSDDRLELLETRNELLDVISGYAQGFDNHDPELLRKVFHADAVLDLGDAFGSYRGIDAILDVAQTFWTNSPHMHHWMANPLFQIDLAAGTASATTALDCLCTYVETGTAHIGGNYRDRYVRGDDGAWQIVERIFDLQFVTPMPDWKPTMGTEAAATAGAA
jgi:hypothetical protein